MDRSPLLDDLTLSWMIKRIKARYEDFPIDDLEDLQRSHENAALAPQHNPRRWLYRLMPRALRSVANIPVNARAFPLLRGFGERNVSRDRHATKHQEMVHISALERLGKVITVETKKSVYKPKNLITVLPNIRSALAGDETPAPIRPVDWNGNPIEAGTPRAAEVLKLVDTFAADQTAHKEVSG